jgi:hypothetical protein
MLIDCVAEFGTNQFDHRAIARLYWHDQGRRISGIRRDPAGTIDKPGSSRDGRFFMTARRWIGSGAVMLLLIATRNRIGSALTPEPVASQTSASSVARPAVVLMPQGAGSCSASACHGSMSPASPEHFPSRVLRNEHTTWITQDRHANAYQVLFTRRSQAMAARLSGGTVQAHKDTRCLSCHTTTGTDPGALAPEVVRQDGVGCESCHGPAERWLGAHTQSWWNSLSSADKQDKFGMSPTKRLEDRASACLECHVGAPGMEVNHDLIAAGHPRLNFEFAAYLALMPPHWVEDTRGNFAARAWAIGQVAAARAALGQLHERAARADRLKDKPAASSSWPEFSEYDCFSCHHDLAGEAWRNQRGESNRSPGTPPWGTWYYPMTESLAQGDRHAETGELEGHFSTLRVEMNRFGPDPGKIARDSEKLAELLGRWLQGMSDDTKAYDATKVRGLIETIEARSAGQPAPGWDGAAQRYLALQPLRLSLQSLDPAWNGDPIKSELERLLGRLQFPRNYDSPRRFDPTSTGGGR